MAGSRGIRRKDGKRKGSGKGRKGGQGPASLKREAAARLEAGDTEGAARLLEACLEATPGDAEALNDLGVIEQRRGRLDEAARHLRAALEQAPESPDVLFNLAVVLREEGSPDEAAGLLERYLDRSADAAGCNLLADILLGQGKRAEAAPVLRRSLELAADQPEVGRVLEEIAGPRPHTTRGLPRRLTFFCKAGLDSFLKPVIDHFASRGCEVRLLQPERLSEAELGRALAAAQVCWFEWCDEQLVRASRLPQAAECRLICRLHSYEAFTPLPSQVSWEAVDDLIFVAPHVKELVIGQVPALRGHRGLHVVPNGVDLGRLGFSPKERGFNVAWLGYINFKKGPMLLLHAAGALVKADPCYQVHVGGRFQEPRYCLYFEQMVKALGLAENFHFHGWVEDVDGWLADKHFVLCTSVFESQGMGVMEAMAKGLKPLIHNFYGASRIYPADLLWSGLDELVALAGGPYEPERYRRLVEERYALEPRLADLEAVVAAGAGGGRASRAAAAPGPRQPAPPPKANPAGPLVSVCIPAYNCERYIGQAIESVLAQTYANLEVVVVDDGSTDGTAKVVKGFGDPRLRHVRQRNGGEASARNACLREARGDYIAWLDADDWHEPTLIERQVAVLEADPEALWVCPALRFEGGPHDGFIARYAEYDTHRLMAECFKRGGPALPGTMSQLIRRRVHEALGPYDESLAIAPDYDYQARLGRLRGRCRYLDEPLYHYRQREGSNMSRVKELHATSAQVMARMADAYPFEMLLGDVGLDRMPAESRHAVQLFLLGKVIEGRGMARAAAGWGHVGSYFEAALGFYGRALAAGGDSVAEIVQAAESLRRLTARPLVSVCIPAYNCERFVGQAIESVLAQTYANLEVVVVDDGSTDGTAKAVRQFADPRLRYVRQRNGGEASARNACLREAKGDYIAWLDADDWFEPTLLERQVEALCARPEALCAYPSLRLVDEAGRPSDTVWSYRDYAARELPSALFKSGHCVIPGTGAEMFRRQVYERLGGYDESLAISPDYGFQARLGTLEGACVHIPAPLYNYRQRGGSNIRHLEGRNRTCARVMEEMTRAYPFEALVPEADLGRAPEGARGAIRSLILGKVFERQARHFGPSNHGQPFARRALAHFEAARVGAPPELIAECAVATGSLKALFEPEELPRATADLREFSGQQPPGLAPARGRFHDEWRRLSPSSAAEFEDFYRRNTGNAATLAAWHDGSAEVKRWHHVFAEVARGRVLDFGAGIGTNCLNLARRGLEVDYFDINQTCRELAAWRFKRHGAQVNIVEEPAGSYDTIFLVDVIGHLFEPAAVLAQLAVRLAPGGLLVVTNDAVQSEDNPLHQPLSFDLEQFLRAKGLAKRVAEGALAIWQRPHEAAAPPARVRPAAKAAGAGTPAGLVVISLDCLRREPLGCYGSPFGASPNLDALAARGLTFDLALCQAPFTPASHAALFTGLNPFNHGLDRILGRRLRAEVPTLAEVLRAEGWRTGAFIGSHALHRSYGLGRGFEHYGDEFEEKTRNWVLGYRRQAPEVVRHALGWLESIGDGPFLLFVHLFDAHDHGQKTSLAYQTEALGRMDAELGRLFAALEARWGLERLVTLALADHGDTFDEHDEFNHRKYVYDSTLRIPCLLAGPGLPSGGRVAGLARTIDMMPTLLELLGLAPGFPCDGASLLAALSGAAPHPEHAYAGTALERDPEHLDQLISHLAAVRTAGWKYVRCLLSGREELYHVAEDEREARDLVGEEPAQLDALRAILDGLVSGGAAVVRPMAAGEQEAMRGRLEALGYF